ncbi:transposase, partial [Geminicoccaceae bacterium 1502E]|nr:transposase [Geminicoccaceae bacterium 1502E]
RRLIIDAQAEWRALDRRIASLDEELAELARNDPAARRLGTIPGLGIPGVTALVAAVGDASAFRKARDLGAPRRALRAVPSGPDRCRRHRWLGLVPRQHTTGGRPRLLGITKRGNRYLRMLLIHGARAAMKPLAASATPLGKWLRGLLARAHRPGNRGNVVLVALANKLARIAWAVLRRQTTFAPGHGMPAG